MHIEVLGSILSTTLVPGHPSWVPLSIFRSNDQTLCPMGYASKLGVVSSPPYQNIKVKKEWHWAVSDYVCLCGAYRGRGFWFLASRVLTCMGLHVLQQIVVELELDPTCTTRVGL